MTLPTTRTSGISKPVLPTVLPCPRAYGLDKTLPLLRDRLVYFIRHYGSTGISILISRQPKSDQAAVLCGDWAGNSLDLVDVQPTPHTEAALKFVGEDLPLFLRVMHHVRVPQAQFFLAMGDDGLILVDMQVAINKCVGPGMLRDVFGKVYKTQEVLKVEPMSDRVIECVDKATGTYEGDLIIKPSKFSTFSPHPDDDMAPLYAEVRR